MTAPATAGPARVKVKVPTGFDPDKHLDAMLARIIEQKGEGFTVQSYDPDTGILTAVRESQIATFVESGDSIHVELPAGTTEAQGPSVAKAYENLKEGWKIIDFRPYAKPGFAVMRKMTGEEIRVREAIAQVMRVARTPWLVQVAARNDGGYDIQVPPSYSPGAHDEKLLEVAETAAGEPGWYVRLDPKTLRGSILPGELPTFPKAIPYPFKQKVPAFKPGDTSWARIPLGRALGRPGEEEGPEFCLNLKSASHTLLQGLPMSGKSVNINAILYWWLSMGGELAIIDTPDKAVDFEWVKPFVRDGGWGPESYAEMVATCGMVYDEGKRRARVLKSRGINNWFDLKDDPTFRPILLVADEYTGLMTEERVPKSLGRDHPMRVEAEETNGFKDMVGTYIQKIALEMRFVGVHVLVSTQLGNTKTGVSTALKAASGNRLLMGPNASDNQRANAFSAPDSVAEVPENVRSTEGVSKGVGVTETEGQPSVVFKGYFAPVDEFKRRLESNTSLRRTQRPEPDRREVAQYTGADDLDSGGMLPDQPTTRGAGGPSTSAGMNAAREMGLQGAAAANFAGKFDMDRAGGA